MRKIFVVSWFYPPINSSEGLVTFKLLKNSKNSYLVFTQKGNTNWSYGNEEINLSAKNIKCIYAKNSEFAPWKLEACDYFLKNKKTFDLIMTRSMPPESHEVGLEIKKKSPNVKWVASFGDPIADNPYTLLRYVKESPYSIKSRGLHAITLRGIFSPRRNINNLVWHLRVKRPLYKQILKERRLQKNILKRADILIFNSRQQMEYMLSNESDEVKLKGRVLYHSYDTLLYPRVLGKKKYEKIIMTYIGGLDSIRTPRPLFEALKRLLEFDKNLSDKFEVQFYGNIGDEDKIFLIDNKLTDVVKYKGMINYIESLEVMQKSDWLLHVDAKLNGLLDENIFFAAKLADYIGSSNKIFAITMPEGSSADIIRKLNGLAVSHSSEEILNYLYLIIYKNYQKSLNLKFKEKFNSKKVATDFDNIVKELIKK